MSKSISAAQVKQLRERTGAGMMDCKRALSEASGDFEQAANLLRERGLGKARGKAGRDTSEGRVAASVSGDGKRAALVEVNCETDFVARTDDFGGLCAELADAVRDREVTDVDALLELPRDGRTWNDRIVDAIAKLGENIRLRRIARVTASPKGLISSYIHAGGKIGTLVALEASDPGSEDVAALVHNLCLHVAATAPSAVTREGLPPEEVERERRVLRAQADAEGKPAEIVERIVEGRLGRYFKEVVLLEQPLVMDPDQTVQRALDALQAEVAGFQRFQLGEESSG